MHICKLSRRKIARECIFSAGVPAYACMKAGAAALKSHCASNIFLREETLLKCPTLLRCSFGGNPPAGKGRAEVTKKNAHLQEICDFFEKYIVLCRFICKYQKKVVTLHAEK